MDERYLELVMAKVRDLVRWGAAPHVIETTIYSTLWLQGVDNDKARQIAGGCSLMAAPFTGENKPKGLKME